MKLARARKYYARHKSMSMKSYHLECADLSSLWSRPDGEGHNAGAFNYLDCGGKRSATPLWIVLVAQTSVCGS
jgi:hypothetical protein